jgi:acyl-CoA synthetase (AMP-forming)/AMP-acid ligase II
MTSTATNVTEYLLAGKDPTRVALGFPQSLHSYEALTFHAGHVAAHLLKIGGRKGDRVLLISDNSLFWVACYLGIMQAGLVCVPIAGNSQPRDVDYILKMSNARIVCAHGAVAMAQAGRFAGRHLLTDKNVPPVAQTASQQTFSSLEAATTLTHHYTSVGPNDLAALIFTSGSTGQPRGVMVSHANIIANTDSIVSYLSLTAQDRIMAVLPFHYCYGASLLHTHLRVGGEVVVDNRFMYPETVLQRMIETRCTGFAGVPSHFQILLRNSSLRKKQFPNLRYVQQAGGYLAPTFIRELREALPNTKIFIMYGQTEATARLSYLPPDYLDAKLGSIGKGMPGMKLRVLNEEGREVRHGEVGEIVAEGASVTLGYWQAPQESEGIFRDGTLYTGDLARVDEDGFIYIVDRAKDFLKCRGEKVSCRQLEEVLLEFDELVEAAVIGIHDDVLGEAVKAFVVPRTRDANGLTERVATFCKSRMVPHHLPKQIVVLPSLPKNSAGKIMKAALKVMVV